MRVLLTGAGGAIGRRVAALLHDRGGFDVTLLVSPRSEDPAGTVVVDVADPRALRAAVEDARPDAVVHLAALTGPACDLDGQRTDDVNVGSVRTLAAAAQDGLIGRIVFASTSAVYGDRYDHPIPESGPVALGSSYARSKHAGERALAESATGESVSLRIFNVFGPGTPGSLVTRLAAATPDRPVELRGLDGFVRDYVHSDDVAAAVVSALSAELPQRHATFNIGSGVPTSNRELIRRLGVEASNYTVGEPSASYSCARIDLATRWLDFQTTRPLGETQ